MCRSQAEGGQRCYSHALKAVGRGIANPDFQGDFTKQTDAWVNLRGNLVDLASTATGREAFLGMAAGHHPDEPVLSEAMNQLMRITGSNDLTDEAGRILQEAAIVSERNNAIKDAVKKQEKWARFGDRALKIAKAFAPSVVVAGQVVRHIAAGGAFNSPTQIGLTLVSAAASVGLGYIAYKKYAAQPDYRSEREKTMRHQAMKEAAHAKSNETAAAQHGLANRHRNPNWDSPNRIVGAPVSFAR